MKKMIIIPILFLIGCSAIVKDYGKRVFKYQNQVSYTLTYTIMELEENNDVVPEKLYNYEDEINEICRPLQRAVFDGMLQKELTSSDKYKASASMSKCQNKASEVKKYLKDNGLWKDLFLNDM